MIFKLNKLNLGQSLIEAVFAITIVMVLVGGVVKLVSQSISAKTKTFDRKVATNLATSVIEDFVVIEKNQPENFWNVGYWNAIDEVKQSKSGYPDYSYMVKINYIPTQFTFTAAKLDVTVSWKESGDSVVISRYFAK
ncbi:MAG TPA: hypothetical protein PK370_01815 [Candidatus Woesebacteria bacterium]|nr:hypothetical protein [Candidatus Woesebacteria bacterium]HPJ17137.1 hypothetical protein [Candidatus Woesebacteria bacterium]